MSIWSDLKRLFGRDDGDELTYRSQSHIDLIADLDFDGRSIYYLPRWRLLELPAVWCAINFLSDTLSLVPLRVHRKMNGRWERDESDEARMVEAILNQHGTRRTSAFDERKGWIVDCLVDGRGYLWVAPSVVTGGPSDITPLDCNSLSIGNQTPQDVDSWTVQWMPNGQIGKSMERPK